MRLWFSHYWRWHNPSCCWSGNSQNGTISVLHSIQLALSHSKPTLLSLHQPALALPLCWLLIEYNQCMHIGTLFTTYPVQSPSPKATQALPVQTSPCTSFFKLAFPMNIIYAMPLKNTRVTIEDSIGLTAQSRVMGV